MLFDWDEYFSIAKSIETRTAGQSQSSRSEAMQRVAISRAYYSMYHLAVNYAQIHLGYSVKRSGPNQDHTNIRSVYQSQLKNPDHQEVKTILSRLHKARLDSDYKSESLGNIYNLLKSVILDADKMRNILTK